MHDIDRTTLETNTDLENYEHEQYKYGEFGEAEWGDETGVFNESEIMELAAELLEISDEAELDQFLGNLIKKASQVAGKFIRSPVGKQLGGLLKGAAKKALPMVGSAIGGYFGGTSGARVGSQMASNAGRIFGLELEGLSHEDQEYEVAKRFVQLAGAAAKNASCQKVCATCRSRGKKCCVSTTGSKSRNYCAIRDSSRRTATCPRPDSRHSTNSRRRCSWQSMPFLWTGCYERSLDTAWKQNHSVRSITRHGYRFIRSMDA
jgi:hypothetical protein